MNPFGLVFSFKLTAIAVAIAFAAGGIGGMRVEKKLSDANYYKSLTRAYAKAVATLKNDIQTTKVASEKDAKRAAAAEVLRAKAEEKANALQARIKAGDCFDADDAERVRELWSSPGRRRGG